MPSTPFPEDPAPSNPGFTTFIADLMPKVRALRASREYALDYGITEQDLDRYAAGSCSTSDRQHIQHVLARCQWAVDHVIKRVREQRSK